MKRLIWAALFALPTLAVSSSSAQAQCCGGGGYSGKSSFFSCSFGFCKPCFSGKFLSWLGTNSCGYSPGPWYTFWPEGGQYYSPYASAGWTYDQHFQIPAPIPNGQTGFGGWGYAPSYSGYSSSPTFFPAYTYSGPSYGQAPQQPAMAQKPAMTEAPPTLAQKPASSAYGSQSQLKPAGGIIQR